MAGIAGMIGGAIFVLTGPAIGLAGSAVIIAFAINGVITLITAMVYAELGSAIPEAGGGYQWIREGLPRPNAFISGWMAWFAHIVAGSLYAVGFGAFAYSLFQISGVLPDQPLLGVFPYDKLIAVASVAAFTYVNVKGTSETGKAGTVVTFAQLGTIVVILGFGFWSLQYNPNWEAEFAAQLIPLGLTGLVAAMGLTFIAFEGYEIIVQTGEEVKNPKRNIPKAIFISLGVVVALYCLMGFVAVAAAQAPAGEQAWQFIGRNGELGITKVVDQFMPYGAFVVLAGGIVSTLAALNATTFSSSRVALAMGRNYNLPHAPSSIHPVNRTPYVAAMVSGIIMAVMAYTQPLADIALAAGVVFLLLFTQINIAAITIRRIYGDKLTYGYKVPLFPAIPIAGIFLNGLAEVLSRFGAAVVKNVGDSLLYYFPDTESEEPESFRKALRCCFAMADRAPVLNAQLATQGLPEVRYRTSLEYGAVMVARMSTSSVNDIFGMPVNMCSKMNPLAQPGGLVIGGGLYEKVKGFEEYEFAEIEEAPLLAENCYRVYSVVRR